MGRSPKIEARTLTFNRCLYLLKQRHKMPSNKDLAAILGIKTLSTISEIKAERQNIQPDAWLKFMKAYKSEFPEFQREIEKQNLINEFDRSSMHTFHEAVAGKKFTQNFNKEPDLTNDKLNEDDATYGSALNRLLTMLEREQNNVSKAHEIIKILADKVPKLSDDGLEVSAKNV